MMEEYCEVGRSYYAILGVSVDSSGEEIRRAYRKLAMQWHPDKWTRNPSLLGEAKMKFQQIQEAYSVLSDPRKKTMYDAGLYDPDEEVLDEGFADFLQEMVSLMDNVRKEESSSGNGSPDSIQGKLEACQNVNKVYTMEELQSMFWEMAQGFETTEWSSPRSQSMYSSHWLQESFTFSDHAASSGVPWPDVEKCLGVSTTAPCSSVGNHWSKSFTHFGDGQRVL